ncbi:hypothetical protein HPB48_006118 [Haemaphysalis longicornis]|uniref:Palmitoyltransferase n=1 Tax=Haemaphysalis longicornis TaxID=44386 RepID=A0A9J6GSY4_HAELO|nr:hypothetical protein HPB48_006118 [Haemaphysalis longicornis]
MDHHCPWFNNCVSFTNLKAFLLTLLYSSLLAGYTALTGGIHAVIAWISLGLSLVSVQVTILVAGGTYLSTALATFLFVHLDQLSRNLTSLESSRMTVFQESGDSFDLGWSENFVQVNWFWRAFLLHCATHSNCYSCKLGGCTYPHCAVSCPLLVLVYLRCSKECRTNTPKLIYLSIPTRYAVESFYLKAVKISGR